MVSAKSLSSFFKTAVKKSPSCVLVRVLQKYYTYGIYYKESAYTIMEADKSEDLQSASWRPKGR